MLRNYEGLFLLKPELEKEESNDLYQKIQDTTKKHKGEIEGVEEWGKRPLAYKIGKYAEGVYYLLKFKIDPRQITKLGSDFKLNESIIRMMFTQPSIKTQGSRSVMNHKGEGNA